MVECNDQATARQKTTLTRIWASAQRDGHPVDYRWRPLLNEARVWLTPTTWVPCSNAANIEEHKTWTQSESCSWQNSIRDKSPKKCIYSVPALEMAKHRAKFGWLPLHDVGAVTLPRLETRWNLLGCPKLPNRSQPLVDRRSRHSEKLWRRYCCLTVIVCPIVDTCLSCEDIARPTILCDGAQTAIFLRNFCVLYFQRVACNKHFRRAL